MRVLDACVPRRFKAALEGHAVTSVGELLGGTDLDDGPLLLRLREQCDAFVTTDRSIPFQQNLADLPFAVVVLRARSNRLEHLLPLAPLLLTGLRQARAGQVHYVGV